MEPRREPSHDPTAEWSRNGPLAWLDTLRENPSMVFYVNHAADAWIREADLAPLVAAMASTAPAAVVCYVASAHAVAEQVQSTVGHEAAILVDSFRRKRSYPGGCSDLTVVDAETLQQWWRQRTE